MYPSDQNFRQNLVRRLSSLTILTVLIQSSHAFQQPSEAVLQKNPPAWSEPVNGIRARLIASNPEFTCDFPTSLIILFQNISDRPVSVANGVRLMPTLAMKGERPHGQKHGFNMQVWLESHKKRLEPLWAREKSIREKSFELVIQPNDIYTVIVNIRPVSKNGDERLRQKVIPIRSDIQIEDASLSTTEPGSYLLKAVWKPEGLSPDPSATKSIDKKWRGKQIEIPPIEIRIQKEQFEERVEKKDF